MACQEGLILTVDFCLKHKPELVYGVSAAQWTPLMNACEAGDFRCIKKLLNYDRSLLDYKSECGTPLHAAITGKEPVKTTKYLLTYSTEIVS